MHVHTHITNDNPCARVEKRVLAIAYACNPYRGSEHGVGWGWLGMIAQNHKVWCLCCENDRKDIEKFCSDHPESAFAVSVTFIFVRHVFSVFITRYVWKPYYLWTYRKWQKDAYVIAKKLHEEQPFDLCHLITYVGFRVPGLFYKLDCPFIWGPIGGLENTPWRYLPALGLKGGGHYGVRNLINSWQKRFLERPKDAFSNAAESGAVIAATSSIQSEIRKWYGVDSTVICEVGPPSIGNDVEVVERKDDEPLRLCWSGRHQPGKALPLLLKALVSLPAGVDWHLDVLGDGPCRKKWMRQAGKLGLNDRIKWHGQLPRAKAGLAMRHCHLFVITSLKDLTSSVLLEALALGLPVICPDHCGFSDVVDGENGLSVPVDTLALMPLLISEAVEKIYFDESLRKALAQGALLSAGKFSWASKREALMRSYNALGCHD